MSAPMKALTVRQPWAWAIAAGVKTVENRTRGTQYRGPLAIHAGKGYSQRGDTSPLIEADYRDFIDRACHHGSIIDFDLTTPEAHIVDLMLERGSIIAVTELVDSHVADTEYAEIDDNATLAPCCSDRYAEFRVYSLDARDPSRDVVHLVLADVVRLDEPVSCRGALGFWTVPADVAELVDAQLRASA